MIAGDFGSVNTANGNISATYGNRGNVSMVKRKSRRIDPEVYDEIHRRVREGSFTNAAELHRELVEQFPEDAPSERTVRSIVKELTPPTTSGIWQPGPDADPEDAALILETVAEHMSRGKRRWPRYGKRSRSMDRLAPQRMARHGSSRCLSAICGLSVAP